MAGVRWSAVYVFVPQIIVAILLLLCHNNYTINDRHGGEHEQKEPV